MATKSKEKNNRVAIVSFTESSEARRRAHKLVSDVRNHKVILDKYKFNCLPIGSQKRKCIVKDIDGRYDLDFQIVLTQKSNGDVNNPTQIKKDFFRAFTDCANKNEQVEDSTTVITVRASKNVGKFDARFEKFSFDFVIISADGERRIKRNAQSQYTWTQLPTRNSDIYEAFNSLSLEMKKDLLENCLLPKILQEKSKPKDQREATIVLFYRETNNYIARMARR